MSSTDSGIPIEIADIAPEDLERAREMSYLEQRVSAITAIISMDVASEYGLNITDFLALGAIVDSDGLTPGDLATELGLTTGSITALLDRLERVGYVRRERSETDRRKVLIYPACERPEMLSNPFMDLTHPYCQHLETYTPEELDTVRRYLTNSHEMLRDFVVARRARRKEQG